MKKIKCNKCGHTIVAKAFYSEKVTCHNCNTEICFNKYRVYQIVKWCLIICMYLLFGLLLHIMKHVLNLNSIVRIFIGVILFMCLDKLAQLILSRIRIFLYKR